MKDTLILDFNKLSKVIDYLKIPIFDEFIKESNDDEVDFTKLYVSFYNFASDGRNYGNSDEMIKEILEIDYEKKKLGDAKEDLDFIRQFEKSANKVREKILFMSHSQILDLEFSINHYAKLYESNWQIIGEFENDREHLISNLTKSKSDYYFLLQKTGIFDHILKTNVLEYNLNEQEYLLLRIFENPKKAEIALNEYCNFFKILDKYQYNEIKTLFISILRDCIYRKFIILTSQN